MEYQTTSRINKYFVIQDSISDYGQSDSSLFLDEFEKELFEERAAIMEYEGHLSRPKAEKLAFKMILRQRRQLAQAS